MMKIALGTVQFGTDYGISNTKGRVPLTEIASILDLCKKNGVDTLDTAQGYGESERVLGQFDLTSFKIVTKLMGEGKVETSLKNLNLNSVYALMFHREEEVNINSWARFEAYKKEGLVKKIGVSVYNPDALEDIIMRFAPDIVQIPFNLLDRRFEPLFPLLKKTGTEVHCRSVFLQGLILMKNIPPYFEPIKPLLQSIPSPKINYALALPKAEEKIDKIVIGVTNRSELEQALVAYAKGIKPEQNFDRFKTNDEKFINPSNWRIKK